MGVPDEKWGEVGKTFIVIKPGERMDPDEVLDFIRGKLAKYRIPRYVEFVKGLLKTPSGKILKNLLKTRNFGSENSQPSPKCRDKQRKSP